MLRSHAWLVLSPSVFLATLAACGGGSTDSSKETSMGSGGGSTSSSSGTAATCGVTAIDSFYAAAGTSVPSDCSSCVASNCCASGDACDGDPECVSFMACVGGCSANDETCISNCANTYGGTSGNAFNESDALLNCAGSCSSCT